MIQVQEGIRGNIKKRFWLFLSDEELNNLKKEAREMSKIIGKNLSTSKWIRVKLRLDGNGKELLK